MKKLLVLGFIAAGMFCASTNANAQLGGLLKKAAKGVVDKAKKTVSETAESATSTVTGATNDNQTKKEPFVGYDPTAPKTIINPNMHATAIAKESREAEEEYKRTHKMQTDQVLEKRKNKDMKLTKQIINMENTDNTDHSEYEVVEVVITSPTYQYRRTNLGQIVSRYVSYGRVMYIKSKNAYFYADGYSAHQAYNGSGYDETVTPGGVPVTTALEVENWSGAKASIDPNK